VSFSPKDASCSAGPKKITETASGQQPTSAERQRIGTEFQNLVGEMSWETNPENEKRLFEILEQYPLYEVLTFGMTEEQKIDQIMNLQIKKKARNLMETLATKGAGRHTNKPVNQVKLGQLFK